MVGPLEERMSLAFELSALDREACLSHFSCPFFKPCLCTAFSARFSVSLSVHLNKNIQNAD